MQIKQLHGWKLSYLEAKKIQTDLASGISTLHELPPVKYIAGVDASVISASRGRAAAVIVSYPGLNSVEYKTAEAEFRFPYIPGLLSFRELPAILSALEKIEHIPDLVLMDGQGLAHPRKFGIASHLGLILDIATIGCAKSRLCGEYGEVPAERGGYSHLTQNNEIIGAALRTKYGAKPVFVSIGHRIDLQTSIKWIMNCCGKYRLPEPCRLAHIICKRG